MSGRSELCTRHGGLLYGLRPYCASEQQNAANQSQLQQQSLASLLALASLTAQQLHYVDMGAGTVTVTPACPHPDWRVLESDAVACTACGQEFSGECMAATQHLWWKTRRERVNGGRLADECQTLKDENTQLLAENARLRRRLEAK